MTKFEEIWKEATEKADLKYNEKGTLSWVVFLKEELKSRIEPIIQQQALAVVPEDVAKLPPFDGMKEYVLDERLLTIREFLNKLDDKSNNEITEAEAWCMIHEDIAYRAMLYGYTVEKPQLFLLKHIDMSNSNEDYDRYLFKDVWGFLQHDTYAKGKKPTDHTCKFTQKEIDTMNIGSYEQIPVPVEDGE